MKGFFSFLSVAATLAAALPAGAADDFALTYRGRITAQQEMPVELEVTYSLYVGEDDSSPVWTQTKTERPAANGAFQSVLTGDGLQAAFQDQKARFLGLRLGGPDAAEQYPRQEILSVPLAEYADAVEEAPFSPEFVNAEVETLTTANLCAGDLVVGNVWFRHGGDLRLDTVRSSSQEQKLFIMSTEYGYVRLFSGQPLECSIESESSNYVEAGTPLFDGQTTKGGLLAVTTPDASKWDEAGAAPCITIPVGPGVVHSPVQVLSPAKFYLYEFGN